MALDYNLSLDELPVGCVNSHFLDSGSFTFWAKAQDWSNPYVDSKGKALKIPDRSKLGRKPEDYYQTEEFREGISEYMDDYAAFVKKYASGIDYYANVDVIPDPELTWKNQKYLENEHGLTPVPVVHYRTDLKWLQRYIDEGYEYIGLGGLVGSTKQEHCQQWLDRAFNLVCDTKDRKPKVRIHGFGVTVYSLLLRYPWFSVDSTTWTKVAAFGGILVPHKRGGKFVFDRPPYIIKTSHESPTIKNKGQHVLTLSKSEKKIVEEWLEKIDIPLGKLAPDKKTVEEWGVITRHTERRVANLLYFEAMQASLPEYPWPFITNRRRGFGLLT